MGRRRTLLFGVKGRIGLCKAAVGVDVPVNGKAFELRNIGSRVGNRPDIMMTLGQVERGSVGWLRLMAMNTRFNLGTFGWQSLERTKLRWCGFGCTKHCLLMRRRRRRWRRRRRNDFVMVIRRVDHVMLDFVKLRRFDGMTSTVRAKDTAVRRTIASSVSRVGLRSECKRRVDKHATMIVSLRMSLARLLGCGFLDRVVTSATRSSKFGLVFSKLLAFFLVLRSLDFLWLDKRLLFRSTRTTPHRAKKPRDVRVAQTWIVLLDLRALVLRITEKSRLQGMAVSSKKNATRGS